MHQTKTVDQFVAPFVDGRLAAPFNDLTLVVTDPSTGRVRSHIPAGSTQDVDHAVASCRRSFEAGRWADASPSQKKIVLRQFADLITSSASDLDTLDAGEMGKPVSLQQFNAASAAELMRFFAEAVDKVNGELVASDKNSLVGCRLAPRGVVAAVVPWNFPTFNAVLKVAPALAAGNSVILKPSENSSRSAIRLAHLAMQAGLPEGVFNVVPGSGETAGRLLGLHPDVDMLTFTGSTDVGKLMLCYSGQSNMKVVMTECGGKSPHVVFADCSDPDAIGDYIAGFLLSNQGQTCSVGSRLLVEKSIEKELVDRIASRMDSVIMGNALDPATTFGPLVSPRQFARVMNFIQSAESEGAELVVGGGRALAETGGYFVQPTIFRNVRPDARIAREEIFGPVLSVATFEGIDDAIRLANGTIYGLMAYVWTSDFSTAMRVAKGIRSSVLVNAVVPHGEGPGHSFSSEPAGQSGLGVEGGLAGLERYSRRQTLWFNHA